MNDQTPGLPEPYRRYATPPTEGAPAHHRPPNVAYMPDGTPVHFTVGQPPQQPIVLQAPVHQGMDPALFRLIVITFLIVLVMVTVTGCVCAVVVLMGGTLIGIIGAVGQNLTAFTLTLLGAIVAAGWAASKIRPAVKTSKKGR